MSQFWRGLWKSSGIVVQLSFCPLECTAQGVCSTPSPPCLYICMHCYDIETIHVHQSVRHWALLCFSVTVFVRHVVCCGPLLGLSILCAVMDCTLVIIYSAVLFCCK